MITSDGRQNLKRIITSGGTLNVQNSSVETKRENKMSCKTSHLNQMQFFKLPPLICMRTTVSSFIQVEVVVIHVIAYI